MTQRIIERAWRAYVASDGLAAPQPDSLSSVETIGGLSYAVLRGECGLVAVYRINTRGRLQRMKRPPLALNSMGRTSARERVQIAGAAP